MACPLAAERVWVEKSRYHDAEREYYERLAKLLKGTISNAEQAIEETLPITVSPKKSKTKKNKKNMGKSQSPEVMPELNEVVSVPKVASVKTKKQKKIKLVESEASSSNSLSKDVSPSFSKEESIPVPSEAIEETKSKKKKKKKFNKDGCVDKQVEEQENIPPNQALIEIKTEHQDSNKKPKNLKIKGPTSSQCTLVSEIAKARQHIKNSLEKMDGIATLAATPACPDIVDRLAAVEKDNIELRQLIEGLKKVCMQSESRIKSLEEKLSSLSVGCVPPAATKVEHTAISNKNKDEDDDGVDLFASDSDEESTEAAKIREERLAAYAAKKSKKPALIAKSSLVLDVKPWDDETDMKALEAEVRKITTEGLLWGASKFAPVAFGITKLSISCVVEDDKVSIDWLTEEIEKLEDYVQSVDVAAFNKI